MPRIDSATITDPARLALQEQLGRLKGWARRATKKDDAKISLRAEELKDLFGLLEYTELLEGEILKLAADRDRIYAAGYAAALAGATDYTPLVEVIQAQTEKLLVVEEFLRTGNHDEFLASAPWARNLRAA